MSEENKKNASERLTDLENNQLQIAQALQSAELMAREFNGVKEALKLLNNKLDAVVKAVNQGGPITDEILTGFMVLNNVKDLENKVSSMVAQGVLASSDTVTADSFVVINEVDPQGNVVNPRMQFLLSALNQAEVQTKLNGAKVGDNLKIGDQGASITVLETYNVVTPKASEIASETVSEVPSDAPVSDASTAAEATPSEADVSTTATA